MITGDETSRDGDIQGGSCRSADTVSTSAASYPLEATADHADSKGKGADAPLSRSLVQQEADEEDHPELRTEEEGVQKQAGELSKKSASIFHEPSEPPLQQRQQQQQPELDWSVLKYGRLFGRDKEILQLQRAFQRRLTLAYSDSNSSDADSGNSAACDKCRTPELVPELILISGGSGTGKTVLVKKALRDLVEKSDGFYLTGKFDQLQAASEPYRPFVAALTQLAIAMEDDTDNSTYDQLSPKHILKEVGVESCRALTALVPALGRPLGLNQAQQQALQETNTHQFDAQQDRIKVALIKLFQVVCSSSSQSKEQQRRPVVLIMDDLQWADAASLDLLEHLIAMETKDNGYLMVVGICRDNEVPWHHTFAGMLRRLEDEKDTNIVHVAVKRLSVGSTNALLSALLRQSQDRCLPLAEMIHQKSDHGNVFFILQLLKSLYQEGVLVAEPLLEEGIAYGHLKYQWLWHDDKWSLLASQGSLDVVGLVSHQILRLPNECQHLLKIAACIGAEVDSSILLAVLPKVAKEEVPKNINHSVRQGMMVEHLPQYPGRYSFAHDRIQQAAYSLISEEDRPMTHIFIGRSLLHELSSENLESNIFLVVNQLIQGSSLLTSAVDKNGVSELCVRAGKKASRAGDFDTARSYFKFGASLLSLRHWRDQYHMSLELFTSQAEVECCTANYEDMEALLEEVFENSRSYKDKIRAYLTQIHSLGTRTRFQDAIGLALQVLAHLGERIPTPRMIYLLPELLKVQRRLKSKSDDDICRLPDFDPDNRMKAGAMSILNSLVASTFCAAPEYFPFVVLRMIKLSLKYGVCDTSCLGFTYYGGLLCAMDKFQEGYRYGSLGLRLLLTRCQASKAKSLPRLNFGLYGMISPWTKPLRASEVPLASNVNAAIECGDIECAQFTAQQLIFYTYFGGRKLAVVDGRLEQYKEFMSPQSPWLALIMLVQQSVDNLTANSADCLSFLLDQEMGPTSGSKQDFLYYECVAMTVRLQLAYHFGDIDLALESARASRGAGKIIGLSFIVTYQLFYDGMAVLEAAHAANFWNRQQHVRWAKKIINRMKVLAKECPSNISHMLYLLQGELHAVKGNLEAAIHCYRDAIRHATTEGASQLHALAHERATIAYQRLGRDHVDAAAATRFMKAAIDAYSRWGASAIVSLLQDKLDQMEHKDT